VDYLTHNHNEPGVYFDNGHFALKEGYRHNGVYIHGPYKRQQNRFKSIKLLR